MAKILIVDDSSMSRRILRNILEAEANDVIEAADGMSALEMYFLHKPDVVLLDLIMKGLYGIEVLKTLRRMDINARVIVASADIQSSSRQMAETEGALAFVTKPFVAEEIVKAVSAAIKEPKPCS